VEFGTDRRDRLAWVQNLAAVVALGPAGSPRMVCGSCHSYGMSFRHVSGAHNSGKHRLRASSHHISLFFGGMLNPVSQRSVGIGMADR